MSRGLAITAVVASDLVRSMAAHGDATLPPPAAIPQATPVLAVDDTRAHGPTARNWIDLEIDARLLAGPRDDGVQGFTEQLSLGLPTFRIRELHELLAPYAPYELRVRSSTFHTSDGWLQGPLTVGLQRYLPLDPIAIAPLVYAHWGVEAVASTPWLSDRHASPPRAVRILDGVDTELAENGWSLRPASPYVRGDFLACRSFFVDAGGAPELFVPDAGPDEYHLRFHAATGWSFGCASRATSHRPKVSVEYRGRVRLHAGDAPAAYRDSLGLGLQYDLAGVVVQALASTDPGRHTRDYWMLGLRLQFGLAKGS